MSAAFKILPAAASVLSSALLTAVVPQDAPTRNSDICPNTERPLHSSKSQTPKIPFAAMYSRYVKFERPSMLFVDGSPTYFIAPSGTNILNHGGPQSFIFRLTTETPLKPAPAK